MAFEQYREHAPDPRLVGLVECYWTYEARDASPFSVLPDGCIDLVLDMAGDGPTRLVGPMTRPSMRRGGDTQLFGIRFRPGGARALLGVRCLQELRDGEAETVALGRARKQKAVEDELLAAAQSMSSHERTSAQLAERCFVGRESVAEIADAVGMSRQHLRRRVVEASGLAPKVLSRIGRARRLREALDAGALPTVDTALASGYCDQSHMIGEFRELMGMSPGAYVA